MNIMLAIVIPYYKLTFFEETLKSLSAQTDKRFKVYVGNDGSPESPESLLNQFKGQFDFSYHRFDNNLGSKSLTQQWDRCIALTQEEPWIMILGDDDVLDFNVVKYFYSQYELFSKETSLIRFATVTIDGNSQKVSDIYKHPLWERSYDFYFRRLTHQTRSSLSEYIFTQKIYKRHGFYNYPMASHSDDRAWIDFSEGYPIYSINNAIVFIRMSTINISGRKDNVMEKHHAQLLFYNYLVKEKLSNFNEQQRGLVLLKYEKIIFANNHVSYNHYFDLFFIYLKNFKIKEIIGLKIRVIKHFLNIT